MLISRFSPAPSKGRGPKHNLIEYYTVILMVGQTTAPLAAPTRGAELKVSRLCGARP